MYECLHMTIERSCGPDWRTPADKHESRLRASWMSLMSGPLESDGGSPISGISPDNSRNYGTTLWPLGLAFCVICLMGERHFHIVAADEPDGEARARIHERSIFGRGRHHALLSAASGYRAGASRRWWARSRDVAGHGGCARGSAPHRRSTAG